jgi:hypothetical protein
MARNINGAAPRKRPAPGHHVTRRFVMSAPQATATGHVKRIQRESGLKLYAKYRVNGHQTTKLIGPAWLKRGKPPAGYFTPQMAGVELLRMMEAATSATNGTTGSHTFGQACDEWLRYLEQEKQVAEGTLSTDRSAVRARLVPVLRGGHPYRGDHDGHGRRLPRRRADR